MNLLANAINADPRPGHHRNHHGLSAAPGPSGLHANHDRLDADVLGLDAPNETNNESNDSLPPPKKKKTTKDSRKKKEAPKQTTAAEELQPAQPKALQKKAVPNSGPSRTTTRPKKQPAPLSFTHDVRTSMQKMAFTEPESTTPPGSPPPSLTHAGFLPAPLPLTQAVRTVMQQMAFTEPDFSTPPASLPPARTRTGKKSAPSSAPSGVRTRAQKVAAVEEEQAIVPAPSVPEARAGKKKLKKPPTSFTADLREGVQAMAFDDEENAGATAPLPDVPARGARKPRGKPGDRQVSDTAPLCSGLEAMGVEEEAASVPAAIPKARTRKAKPGKAPLSFTADLHEKGEASAPAAPADVSAPKARNPKKKPLSFTADLREGFQAMVFEDEDASPPAPPTEAPATDARTSKTKKPAPSPSTPAHGTQSQKTAAEEAQPQATISDLLPEFSATSTLNRKRKKAAPTPSTSASSTRPQNPAALTEQQQPEPSTPAPLPSAPSTKSRNRKKKKASPSSLPTRLQITALAESANPPATPTQNPKNATNAAADDADEHRATGPEAPAPIRTSVRTRAQRAMEGSEVVSTALPPLRRPSTRGRTGRMVEGRRAYRSSYKAGPNAEEEVEVEGGGPKTLVVRLKVGGGRLAALIKGRRGEADALVGDGEDAGEGGVEQDGDEVMEQAEEGDVQVEEDDKDDGPPPPTRIPWIGSSDSEDKGPVVPKRVRWNYSSDSEDEGSIDLKRRRTAAPSPAATPPGRHLVRMSDDLRRALSSNRQPSEAPGEAFRDLIRMAGTAEARARLDSGNAPIVIGSSEESSGEQSVGFIQAQPSPDPAMREEPSRESSGDSVTFIRSVARVPEDGVSDGSEHKPVRESTQEAGGQLDGEAAEPEGMNVEQWADCMVDMVLENGEEEPPLGNATGGTAEQPMMIDSSDSSSDRPVEETTAAALPAPQCTPEPAPEPAPQPAPQPDNAAANTDRPRAPAPTFPPIGNINAVNPPIHAPAPGPIDPNGPITGADDFCLITPLTYHHPHRPAPTTLRYTVNTLPGIQRHPYPFSLSWSNRHDITHLNHWIRAFLVRHGCFPRRPAIPFVRAERMWVWGEIGRGVLRDVEAGVVERRAWWRAYNRAWAGRVMLAVDLEGVERVVTRPWRREDEFWAVVGEVRGWVGEGVPGV